MNQLNMIKYPITLLLFTSFGFLLISCSTNRGAFQLALLPDTQTYTKLYPELFYAQTEWLALHADEFAFVLQQGDITDYNAVEQWEVAVKGFENLDGKIPYIFAPGNHDLGNNADVRDSGLMNKYLPYNKYAKLPNFGGAFKEGEMDNTWHTFKAGGLEWLVLSLEFGPRNSVLNWAGEIIRSHPEHKVIINTHAYMYSDNTRMGPGDMWLPQDYGIGKETGDNTVNDGEMMWEKLISLYPNIMFVFSGHVLHTGSGTLVSEGINGNQVYQMLANYQEGVEGVEKGGSSFMRILHIDPKKGKIEVKTYSPYLNVFKTEQNQEFVFDNVKF